MREVFRRARASIRDEKMGPVWPAGQMLGPGGATTTRPERTARSSTAAAGVRGAHGNPREGRRWPETAIGKPIDHGFPMSGG